jgi:hypothetical protein
MSCSAETIHAESNPESSVSEQIVEMFYNVLPDVPIDYTRLVRALQQSRHTSLLLVSSAETVEPRELAGILEALDKSLAEAPNINQWSLPPEGLNHLGLQLLDGTEPLYPGASAISPRRVVEPTKSPSQFINDLAATHQLVPALRDSNLPRAEFEAIRDLVDEQIGQRSALEARGEEARKLVASVLDVDASPSTNPLDIAMGLGKATDAFAIFARAKIESVIHLPVPDHKPKKRFTRAMELLATVVDVTSRWGKWALKMAGINGARGSEKTSATAMGPADESSQDEDERRVIEEVRFFRPKRFQAWLQQRDDCGTSKLVIRKAFTTWLGTQRGKELAGNEAVDFDDVVKEAMTRLRIRFKCPDCGEPARLSYWSTKGLFQFVHSNNDKHARSSKVPDLKLVAAPRDQRRR